MYIAPQIKNITILQGKCVISDLVWNFAPGTDDRVINAAKRISDTDSGIVVRLSHGSESAESYTIDINENDIEITSPGAAGAFYALMTLKMLKNSSDGIVDCCRIEDAPDMEYRGFYHDITRGRIATLDSLKKMVDTMADYKLNSLQLYVEHTYEFKEYEFCREECGFITKAEIMELDEYCKERFIKLIPSLATFGHLYRLLSSDKYKHLCELQNYVPERHYYIEKMEHHTINPLLDESFELITSLINQHMEAFSSDIFNICCDETFDLGADVNSDMNKGDLYIGFVNKLVNYLESKGKTVMMWGDIILKYPERLSEISDKVIFLNWDYSDEPDENNIAAMKDVHQIVCPGTTSWNGFHEVTEIEEGNILKLTSFGAKYRAKGVLNTNWGDLGNPASIEMAMYGLILGAAASWRNDTRADDSFKKFVSDYYYGCTDAFDILDSLSKYYEYSSWLRYNWNDTQIKDSSSEKFEEAMDNCNLVIDKIKLSTFKNDDIKNNFLIAAQGDSLIISWNAKKYGYNIESSVDFDSWVESFRQNWLNESKKAELDTLTELFTEINKLQI